MKKIALILCMCFTVIACSEKPQLEYSEDRGIKVDERSYQIGMLSGFAELVKLGLKPMAVSGSFTTSDMDILFPDLQKIAKIHDIQVYRDNTPLQSDLETFDRAEIVLFYKGDTLTKYLAIKTVQQKLMDAKQYQGEARQEIAMNFGRLMGYTDADIIIWLQSGE